MSLTVLSVAYPLAPVGFDSVGGAEQVLSQLDAALVRAGHRSIVIASEGSKVEGILVATPGPNGPMESHLQHEVQEHHRKAIEVTLERWSVDLVHMHGIDFNTYLPRPGVPVLVTLHLPPEWYPPEAFQVKRPDTYLQCVSASQRKACPPGAPMVAEIENGVPVDQLRVQHEKRHFVMSLGRICLEKGFHHAFDAAAFAQVPFILAGAVFPYREHQRYFEEYIVPRLCRSRRYIGPADFDRKRRLLTASRALLVPSLVPETSSLVSMEALACGTPVIAYPKGALPDIIEHGKTGYLVNGIEEMADAIAALDELDTEYCRQTARTRFSQERMVARYLATFHQLVQRSRRKNAYAV